MNYRELLERYKQGLANEEEKKLIEEDLEKYEALEEYLSGILDEELEDMTKTSGAEIHEEETVKLKKSVNKRLRKVVLTSVLTVAVLYVGIFYGVSAIINGIYYNPTAVTQSEKQQYQSPDFYYDMKAYISLNMPGYAINSFTFQEPKGFGRYELSYPMRDLFANNEQRYFVNISRGRLTYAMDGIFGTKSRFGIWEGFQKMQRDLPKDTGEESAKSWDKEDQRKNEETIRYLKELNPLSYISMSIVFNKDLTMEEFYQMSKAYPSLSFKWVGIRTVEPGAHWSETQPMHLIGFNPNYNDEPSSTQRPDTQKYPLFNLVDIFNDSTWMKQDYAEAISEVYRIHFRSRLEYLKDRKEFVGIFDYNEYKTDFYEDALAYINEHGVKTYGVLVYGTAKDFSEHIGEIPYDTLYINEVLPAKPNIYYK